MLIYFTQNISEVYTLKTKTDIHISSDRSIMATRVLLGTIYSLELPKGSDIEYLAKIVAINDEMFKIISEHNKA